MTTSPRIAGFATLRRLVRLVVLPLIAASTLPGRASPALEASLARLESRYDGFLGWHAARFDPETGRFNPDNVEENGRLLAVLETCGLTATMPPVVRAGLVRYFQSRQDPSDGHFRDHPGQAISDRDLGRHLSFALRSLRYLGAKPLHPAPATAAVLPDFLRSGDAYAAWLHALPWHTPWGAGDRIDALQDIIANLADDGLRDRLLDEQFTFLPRIQSQTTGLWGEGAEAVDWNRLSGAAKVAAVYGRWRRTVPLRETVVATTHAHLLASASVADLIHVRNALWVFRNTGPVFTVGEQVAILDHVGALMGPFVMPDGGFSRDRRESSTSGAATASELRRDIHRSVLHPARAIPLLPGGGTYWERPVFSAPRSVATP